MNEIVIEDPNGVTTAVLGCEAAMVEGDQVTVRFPSSAPLRMETFDGHIIATNQIHVADIDSRKTSLEFIQERIRNLNKNYNRLKAVPSNTRHGRLIRTLQNEIENHVANTESPSDEVV